MLKQLRHEHQPQPALSSTSCDASHLLEQDRHLLDAFGGQKLMGLLNHHQRARRTRRLSAFPRRRLECLVRRLLRVLQATQQISNNEIVQHGRSGVRQVDHVDGARPQQELVDERSGLFVRTIEDFQSIQAGQFAEQRAPRNRIPGDVCARNSLEHVLFLTPELGT